MTGAQLYAQASGLKKEGDIVQAKEAYQKILSEHPDVGNVEKVQKELEDLNINMIFSNTPVPGKTVAHEVVPGDTLGALAKTYGTTIELIKKRKMEMIKSVFVLNWSASLPKMGRETARASM